MIYGRTSAALPSRFLREIPEEYLQHKGGYQSRPKPDYSSAGSGYGAYGSGYVKRPRPSYHSESSMTEAASVPQAPMLELNKGDMISHAAFGRGLVLSVMKMGGDALLEIAFDDIGTKKLMANTASAHMKKL